MRRLVLGLMILAACLCSAAAEVRGLGRATVVYGGGAAPGEVHAARELARDLARVCGIETEVVEESRYKGGGGAVFLVGTPATHGLIRKLAEDGEVWVSADDPGPEAFVVKSFPEKKLVVIAGCDERGALYGAYYFSETRLGVDPLEYWTGKEPEKRDGLVIGAIDHREPPPAFELRGYFDNDSDMLANFKGRKLIIEFDLWKEMIDSLARMRYNFIDLFDTMGRTEFWVWPYYTEKFPGYHTDLDLVNQVIDYAHQKGMMTQSSTYLGYEFHHLPYEKKCLSDHHDDWMASYRYLLDKTPVGKSDIIYHSPRDPWWDRPYKCAKETMLGIDPGFLHSRVVNELYAMSKERNPHMRFFCLLWSDGKKMWDKETFKPIKEIDMVWSDDGYGRYPTWPEDRKGHRFGIYIHAGLWKNHVVQDPYPGRIKESVLEAYQRGFTPYIFVNGQDFKHFILNLEAAGRAAWDPEGFDPEAFYLEWATRYFGRDAAPMVVESLKALHESNNLTNGFARIFMETKIYLRLAQFNVPYCRDWSYMEDARDYSEKSLELAFRARELVPPESLLVYDDQILFPARIYHEAVMYQYGVTGVIARRCDLLNPAVGPREKVEAAKKVKEMKRTAVTHLADLWALLEAGGGWDKWGDWSKVENFRKYEPPPSVEEVEKALRPY